MFEQVNADWVNGYEKKIIIDVWQGYKYGALHDLVPFVQFKKREKPMEEC